MPARKISTCFYSVIRTYLCLSRTRDSLWPTPARRWLFRRTPLFRRALFKLSELRTQALLRSRRIHIPGALAIFCQRAQEAFGKAQRLPKCEPRRDGPDEFGVKTLPKRHDGPVPTGPFFAERRHAVILSLRIALKSQLTLVGRLSGLSADNRQPERLRSEAKPSGARPERKRDIN
jgi:hypothetical protein